MKLTRKSVKKLRKTAKIGDIRHFLRRKADFRVNYGHFGASYAEISYLCGMKVKEEKVRYLYTMQEVYDELMKHIKQQNRTTLLIIIWMWIITISLFLK